MVSRFKLYSCENKYSYDYHMSYMSIYMSHNGGIF